MDSISSANTKLFGAAPSPPARPVLLQNSVDLLACDADAIKLSLAAPAARTDAHVGAATAAVLSALQSAAVVAHATATGSDASAASAAVVAAQAAKTALLHAQQLQHLNVIGLTAAAPTAAVATSEAACSQPPVTAAAPVLQQMSDSHAAVDVQTSLQTAAAKAAAAAAAAAEGAQVLAEQLAQGPPPSQLARGAGLLLLLPNSWGDKAKQLQHGKAVLAGTCFTYYTIVQLMSAEGVLLLQGCQQSVKVRVAAEFCEQLDKTGHWSSKAYTASVTPGLNVLLHCSARHAWGKRFVGSCSGAASSYEALYPGLSPDNIAAALGEA
jgi:hypothetical protein